MAPARLWIEFPPNPPLPEKSIRFAEMLSLWRKCYCYRSYDSVRTDTQHRLVLALLYWVVTALFLPETHLLPRNDLIANVRNKLIVGNPSVAESFRALAFKLVFRV